MFRALALCASAAASVTFTHEEFVARLGTNEKAPNRLPVKTYTDVERGNIPESFDARTKWPQCFPPVRDQAKCGSCWAHGAVEALSWRQCIAGNVSGAIQLAPQWMVDCDRGDNGCNGGTTSSAWQYMSIFGVADETCKPYKAKNGQCTGRCDDGSKPTLYYSARDYRFLAENLEDAMLNIMEHGPIETAFSVYSDFMTYKGGIYRHLTGDYEGGHAVMIVGWGVENGEKYWIVQNSWGPNWGENGFFRIARGINECGFEGQLTAGDVGTQPYEPPLPKMPKNYYTVMNVQELGTKQGTAVWVKNGGQQFRQEAYSPGAKIIETGHSGLNDGHFVQYMINGDQKLCMCKDGLITDQNVLQAPAGAKYERSYWSNEGGNANSVMASLLSDFVYKDSLQTLTYTYVDACVENVVTPWSIKGTAFGIDQFLDIVIYDTWIDFPGSLFEDPCECE